MKKNRILILLIIAFALPGLYLFVKRYQSRKKSLVISVDQNREYINRYSFKDDKKKIDFDAIEKNKDFLSATKIAKNKTLEEYFENVLKTYQILDNDLQSENTGSEIAGQVQETININNSQVRIIGKGERFNLLNKFDRPISKDSPSQKNILEKWDGDNTKPVVEIEDIKSEYFDKFYERSIDSLSIEVPRSWVKSPSPKLTKNSINDLKQLKINLDKKAYYRFEIVKMNLISSKRVNINDLKIYITRDKYTIPNVGGKIDMFFRYLDGIIYSTMAMGFAPSTGTYNVVIKSKSLPNWEGLVTSFKLVKRKIPPLQKGFSVVNFEYAGNAERIKIVGPYGEKKNYQGIIDWVKFMDNDALWVLGGQTAIWNDISPLNPWNPQCIKNVNLLAKATKKSFLQFGAYLMCYYTPGNGYKKGGYRASFGYDNDNDTLFNTSFISISDEKRIQDMIKICRKFQQNDNINFIGLDFIRTGLLNGYELVDQFINEMNVRISSKYKKKVSRMKWLARKIENEKNRRIINKWNWWRAHKMATIVNRIIIEANLTKPVWVFTLGWKHGQEHGQDPYMFFDAGAFIDAVMLYHADKHEFKSMMWQWPFYNRYLKNNIMVGNASDVRLLDGNSNNPALEYVYRTKRGYKGIYSSGLAKGIFLHDLSRSLWSKNKGLSVMDWSIVHGHSTSIFRKDAGTIPYRGTVNFLTKTKGKIIIENLSKKKIKNLEIEYINNGKWLKIDDNSTNTFTLLPSQKVIFDFKAIAKKKYSRKSNILGYVLKHADYRKYFFFGVDRK